MPPRMPENYRVLVYDELDSTMDEARRQIAQGVATPFWIIAARQTKGRGRRNRVWTSSAGNLFCTLVLNPETTVAEAAKLSFLTALSVGESLDQFTRNPLRIRFKWPNDVLLDGAKVAGVLLEAESHPAGPLVWLSIGIGVNLAHYPENTEWPATSLAASGIESPHPHAVLEALAARFAHWLERWRREGFAPVKTAWLDRAARVGEKIEVRLDKETLHGIFSTLDDSGALVLTGADGAIRLVSAGDVFFSKD
jgi:BirA family transcriptional regulator, biotin operon repressor / biotin---[acetyl-CoA-carboxylase] ligase